MLKRAGWPLVISNTNNKKAIKETAHTFGLRPGPGGISCVSRSHCVMVDLAIHLCLYVQESLADFVLVCTRVFDRFCVSMYKSLCQILC